ncbi:MAG: hypothetical protein BWX47_00320 [candidate division Hyd24-12 bacterium ADurb.Bin004]|nr:MAG: hypothetical protein BWX47_00320 [candidate division Hyd24-12 bacterium ADurb.Bin004]
MNHQWRSDEPDRARRHTGRRSFGQTGRSFRMDVDGSGGLRRDHPGGCRSRTGRRRLLYRQVQPSAPACLQRVGRAFLVLHGGRAGRSCRYRVGSLHGGVDTEPGDSGFWRFELALPAIRIAGQGEVGSSAQGRGPVPGAFGRRRILWRCGRRGTRGCLGSRARAEQRPARQDGDALRAGRRSRTGAARGKDA